MHTPPPTKRLFFALWPNPALRADLGALSRTRREAGKGRVSPEENLHITLCFLGNLDAARQARMEEAAAALRVPPFALEIDYLASWQRKGVLWLGASQSEQCAPLRELVEALRKAMNACGVKPENRAYQAHITLARRYFDGPAEPVQVPALTWCAEDFVLVESSGTVGRSIYTVLKTWPLRGP